MNLVQPPADFAYHSPHVLRASLPTCTAEVVFLHEVMGVRKFHIIDAPIINLLREEGFVKKLTLTQWNIGSPRAGSVWVDGFKRLVDEITAESQKGSNVCLLGTPGDVALVCAALRRIEGWPLVFAVRELYDIAGPDGPSNDSLSMLESFDKLLGK